jgi:pimeloyl-ACP methyl ester carboxylesterase
LFVSGLLVVAGQVPARGDVVIEEVTFRHGADTLSGNLYRALGTGPFPAVVMILGSDRHDRDYGGVAPALGQHFARAGFSCLVWDKPGVGKSTGDFNSQTLRDRAEETLAAVQFLRAQTDIRRDRVGIWGHSQGGMVAPLAASLSDEVAFLIEVSGWQGPACQQDIARVGAELRSQGFPEADVEEAITFARKRMDMIRGTSPYEDLERAQNAVKRLPWFSAVHFCDRVRFYSARPNVALDTTPWWSQVRCPVLAVYGDRDTSTGPPEPLLEIIRLGLQAAGNANLTVRVLRDADHSLCRAGAADRPAGADPPKERPRDAGPDFVPGYLETMTDWLAKVTG